MSAPTSLRHAVPPAPDAWLITGSQYEYAYDTVPPDWLTVNVCPATVRVPARALPLLASTEYPTVPFPVPLAPLVTCSQPDALLVADHEQPLPERTVTPTEPVPPALGNDCDDDDNE